MENKETKSEEILVIKGITEKESKTGRKFFSVETDKGNFSVFEFDLVAELKKNIGNKVQVECAANDRGFKNMRKFLSVVSTEKVGAASGPDNFAEARQLKDTSIYTSYAKDIFVAIKDEERLKDIPVKDVMSFAIDLVKQDRDAFK